MPRLLLTAIFLFCTVANSLAADGAASTTPSKALISAIRAGNSSAALAKLDSTLKVDHPLSRDNDTLLHIAARSGLSDVVETLLDLGASPQARDTKGRSALHYYAESKGTAAPVLGSLLATGSLLVDDLDSAGRTSLWIACERGDLGKAQALFESGADPGARALDGTSPREIAEKNRKDAILRLFAGSAGPAAPGGTARGASRGYPAPDLSAPLFSPSSLTLPLAARGLILENLALLGRNFRGSPQIDQELRGKALAVALSMARRNRAAVVADAQLRRGIDPTPLPSSSTPLDIASGFKNFARRLDPSTSTGDDRLLAALLLDIAASIDPAISTTGLPKPDWSPAFPAKGPSSHVSNRSPQATPLPVTHASVRTVSQAGGNASTGPVYATVDISSTVVPRPAHAPATAVRFAHPSNRGLEPAVALSKTLYPWLTGYQLVLSVPASQSPADAPTAGLASALLIASHFGSKPVDPTIAVIAGISPGGTLSGVGDIDARLRTAIRSGCRTVILSSDSVPAIADSVVLGSTELVRDLQIYTARDLATAFAIATATPPYAEASTEFLLVQALTKSGRLSGGEAVSRLRKVARSTPGHLSASLLVAAATGSLPKVLSPPTSTEKIRILAANILGVIDPKRGYPHPNQFDTELLGTIRSKLTRHRAMLAPSTRPAADATTDLALLLEKFLHTPPRSGDGNRKMVIALRKATADLQSKLAGLDAAATP